MKPSPHPRLPAWPFVLIAGALLAAAAYLGAHASDPLPPAAMAAIAGCVGLSAIVLLFPLVAHYERLKNEALAERQRTLEHLAATISAAGEQVGIAATGLHGIADLAHRNLRQAEQLPQKLQEKIAEFQAQLAAAADTEKEELERELLALRTSESERLETITQRVAKLTAEWAKLEAATRDQTAVLTREVDARLARLEALARSAGPAAMAAVVTAAAPVAAAELVAPEPTPVSSSPPAATRPTPPPEAEAPASPPKRPRKPRRDPAAAEIASEPAATMSITPPSDEPPPVPAATIIEVAPVAPGTAEPFSGQIAGTPVSPSPTPPQPAARQRPAPPDHDDDAPALGLDLGDTGGAASVSERTLSSDGATRLIATAYIGIGNRLFIRGEGPGLAWDKGMPLQFVSIGKWRWETNDATAPVRFKLYKNDEVECAALGAQSLDPGYQHEVTAAF
ncbi:MAG: hypothetical protein Q8N18_10305 [Opitutaceae bacterium]|nr:hypothetical protein [Opitutaceae bacterium]